MNLFQLNIIAVSVLSISIVYKSILADLGIDIAVYLLTVILMIINSIGLLARSCIEKNIVWLLPFITWGTIGLVRSFHGSPFFGAVGFTATYVYLIFWVLVFCLHGENQKDQFFRYYVKMQVILAVGTAVFGIYQYFIDPTLFGVKPHKLYSDPDILGTVITRRATSFIGSPQNLGLYMAAMCGLLPLAGLKKAVTAGIFALFVACGLLAGSGAFAVFMIFFLFGYYFRQRRWILGAMMGLPLFLAGISIIPYLRKIYDVSILTALEIDYKKHLPFYLPFLAHENPFRYIWGEGLGRSDRLVEVLLGANTPPNWMPGIESYLLKLYYEIGIVGLITFIMLYGTALYRSRQRSDDIGRVIFACLLGLATNLFATPSFNGLTMSYILWPVILFPVFSRSS